MTAKLPNTRALNWVPDLPDFRDHMYAVSKWVEKPPVVDLRPWMSPVEDQGDLGSCTGNAIVGGLEFLQRKKNAGHTDLSRLFVYYNERLIEHTVRQDSGAYIRDGIKTVAKDGVAPEELWPYDVKKFKRRPSKQAYAAAKNVVVSEYMRVENGKQLYDVLAEGIPVVFGFSVYTSFMDREVARTGLMPMPSSRDKLEGGHAVLACGYDMRTRRVLVRNSWGPAWGEQGYFWMPMDYIENDNLCDDFWAMRSFAQTAAPAA